MEIRVAVIPDNHISSYAGKLGKKFGRQYPHRFLVENKRLKPHITLFKINLSRAGYREMVSVLKNKTRQTKSFKVEVSGFLLAPGGRLALNVKSSSKLQKLRRDLHKSLTQSGFSPGLMKSPYRPHITLTRFYADQNAKKVIVKEPRPKLSLTINTIGLCLSRQTQVYKILDISKLKL